MGNARVYLIRIHIKYKVLKEIFIQKICSLERDLGLVEVAMLDILTEIWQHQYINVL